MLWYVSALPLLRVPIVAQQKQIRLGTRRLQVRSLALLSELRIRRCPELWCRSQMQFRSCIAMAVVQADSCSSNQTPSLGTSICCRCGPKKCGKKKKKCIQSFAELAPVGSSRATESPEKLTNSSQLEKACRNSAPNMHTLLVSFKAISVMRVITLS